jgi:RNase P subunit RPR2
MLFEDKSTKCPNCQCPLTWLSYDVRFEKTGEIHEFNFRCDKCSREYHFNVELLIDKCLQVSSRSIDNCFYASACLRRSKDFRRFK